MAARTGLLLPLLLGTGEAAGAAEGSSPLVVAVELRADSPGEVINDEGLADLVVVRPGAPLDRAELRRTLRNLQAAGVADAIEALLVPDPGTPGGSRLLLALRGRVIVESVRLEGDLGIRRADVEAALAQGGQEERAPLSESRLLRGVYRLQDLYREHGYRDARVRLGVEPAESGRTAAVTYRVEAGPRALVSEVRFEGDLGTLGADDLAKVVRMHPGAGLRETALDRDLERLEARLFEAGHRLAEIEPAAKEFGGGPQDLALVYRVAAGPTIELEVLEVLSVDASDAVDERTLRKRGLLAAFDSQRYDEALTLQTVRAIRSDLQTRGHYKAKVVWDVEEGDGVLAVQLTIQPGPVFELAEVALNGNESLPRTALEQHIETTARRAFSAGSGRLVDDVLEEDLDNLRSRYALEGFYEAQVGPPVVRENGERLSLEIPIVEGPRRQVVEMGLEGLGGTGLELEGNKLAGRKLPLSVGGPFHPRLLEDTVEEVRAILEEAGYLSAQVEASVAWAAENTLATVDLRVLPGPRASVDRVIVRGNHRTDSRLIRRTLRLPAGEPVSRRMLLDAQRRLYGLGIFSRVEVGLAPAPPFATRRDVLVRLTEGSDQRLTYGLGFDSEDGVRGLFGYTHANLMGRGLSARFDLRASDREQQIRALLRQPSVGRFQLPVTYSLFGIEEERETFESRRRGVQVEAERVRPASRVGLLYTFKRVELEILDDAFTQTEIDRTLQEVEISSLTPSLFIDRRDDPLLPTRGWTASVQTEYAFPMLDADVGFTKLFAQHTAYLPLGRLGVVAGSLRLGAIEPSGSGFVDGEPLLSDLDSRFVPISERFFAGGRTSHRAYRRDFLGVTGSTVFVDEDPEGGQRRSPAGGNGLVLFNLDYRFPIAGAIGGTVFYDAGNVWSDWEDVDVGDLKGGAGVGLRYLSPIGPLRFEVGWKLDREAGEDSPVYFLSYGNPF